MRTLIPDLDNLRLHLHYNPATGDIRWAENHPPMKAGNLAGSRHGRNGHWYIMFKGERYASHHVAWFLQRGVWPRHRILFRDGDPDNLTFDNLVSESESFSQNPQAIAFRLRAEKLATERRRMGKAESETVRWRDDIKYHEADNTWRVMTMGQKGGAVVIAETATLAEAEKIADDRKYIGGYIATHKYEPELIDRTLTAGADPRSPTYQELARILVYDPHTGRFYYRNDRVNPIASYVNTAGRSVVTFWGRYYSVGMLAWFFTYKRWPRPKAVHFRNGDLSDARLVNLYEKKP
jgi:hypothetical protein